MWEIPTEGKSEEQLAGEGIDALAAWIKEIGAATEISSLGVTDENIEAIADATIIFPAGYHELTRDEVVEILKQSYKMIPVGALEIPKF